MFISKTRRTDYWALLVMDFSESKWALKLSSSEPLHSTENRLSFAVPVGLWLTTRDNRRFRDVLIELLDPVWPVSFMAGQWRIIQKIALYQPTWILAAASPPRGPVQLGCRNWGRRGSRSRCLGGIPTTHF